MNACKWSIQKSTQPYFLPIPQTSASSPLPALWLPSHTVSCFSSLTQHTQTDHAVKQLQDLGSSESQDLSFWWKEAIKGISTLKVKHLCSFPPQICCMAWSWSPSCSLPKPCLQSEDNDILSCWVTRFISICKIFIRASIEKSPGHCNILQIGRAVAQKAELICRKLSSWDKITRNITQQFYLKAFLPSSFLLLQGLKVSFHTQANMIYLGK